MTKSDYSETTAVIRYVLFGGDKPEYRTGAVRVALLWGIVVQKKDNALFLRCFKSGSTGNRQKFCDGRTI